MPYTKEEILRSTKEEKIAYIRLQFTDLFGTIKNVEIPENQLEKALENQIMFDGSSVEGLARIEESDMYLWPDKNTWVIYPWENSKVATLICDIYNPDHTPFTGDPRFILKKALQEARDLGFDSFNIGPEPEFFLFQTDEKGEITLKLNDQAGYFDLAPLDTGENCRRDIVLTLDQMGFEVEASHHEVAPGQHEIDFKYTHALQAADQIQLFKLVVKNVARRYRLHATFMPKPLGGVNGSGMHCHQSLFQGKENAFYDEKAVWGLSQTAQRYLSGLLKHARAFTAITNPLINSYKRLVPGYEAPCYVAWSPKNRSPLVRVPASRGCSTRLEIRSPDPSANPYLTLAVLLKAGLDGIRNSYPFSPPTEQNIYTMNAEELQKAGISRLPANLLEALGELKNSTLLYETLGSHAFHCFIEAKTMEWQQFQLYVHPWERERYLALY